MSFGEGFDTVLNAARAGADWAWAALYRDLSPTVLGYLLSQGAAEPEDLLGETFVQVVRGLERFDGDESGFRSWVFMIAHHRLQDERRRLERRPERPAAPQGLDTPSGQDVEGEALERVSTDELSAVLRRLPPDQRDVLLLRIVGGLTVEEVARAVGKRVGAVKALQRRGVASLRRDLQSGAYPLRALRR